MAEPAYKVTVRRGTDSAYWSGRSNALVKAATPTDGRRYSPQLDKDVHRNVSNRGRLELMTAGRGLYSNNPVVRGALEEMALLAGAVFIPQFAGVDREGYGTTAESWLMEHDKICDVAGWNYGMGQYRRQLVLSVLRDGDFGTLLTETPDGYPQLQTVPAHRIANGFTTYGGTATAGIGYSAGFELVSGGTFDGARLIDGVIINDYGSAIGYRIQDEASATGYRDVPASSLFLSFIPEYSGQLRGFSQLACSTFLWQDIEESSELRLARAKLAASVGLIEKNETGTVDETRTTLESGYGIYNDTGSDTQRNTDALLQYRTERTDGVTNRYYKAGTGSSLEFLDNNNPTLNEREFESEMIRRGLAGLGWSYDFSLNPTGMGGQNGRVVVAKINRRIRQLQDMLLVPAIRRFDGFRLSKAAKLGLLPYSDEWYKWTYQTAAELTSDEKYSSDVALGEMRAGVRTARQVCGARGFDIDEVRAEKEREADLILTIAGRLAKKHGISIQQALSLISDPADNTSLTLTEPPPDTSASSEE